jgi:hypothetical protein
MWDAELGSVVYHGEYLLSAGTRASCGRYVVQGWLQYLSIYDLTRQTLITSCILFRKPCLPHERDRCADKDTAFISDTELIFGRPLHVWHGRACFAGK